MKPLLWERERREEELIPRHFTADCGCDGYLILFAVTVDHQPSQTIIKDSATDAHTRHGERGM